MRQTQTEKIALINGRVHTPMGLKDSLILEAGRIAAVGVVPNPQFYGDMRTIDLQGRTVLPGFCDTHSRLVRWACAQEQIPLTGCRSLEDLLETLSAFVEAHPTPPGGWYQGHGWSRERMRGEAPTKQDLDAVVLNRPALLWSQDGQLAAANSAALEAAGITWEPTGLLRGDAADLAARCVPSPDNEHLSRLLRLYAPRLAALGLTEIWSDDLPALSGDFRRARGLFMEAAASGSLPFRVHSFFSVSSREELLDLLSDGWRTGDGVPLWQAGPVKLLCDGALEDRSALLREDYADAPEERGRVFREPEELEDMIITAHLAGMQLALHVVGDGALDLCLTALERAQAQRNINPRHLLLHAPLLDADRIEKARALRLGLIIHPCALPGEQALTIERLGTERSALCHPWRTLTRKGVILSSGSDAAAGVSSPLAGIQAAVTRSAHAPETEAEAKPWNLDEGLSIAEAIGTYAWNAAWNGRNDRRRGEIAPGRDADLVVLEQDPFVVSPMDLGGIGVVMTLCAGNITYDSGKLTAN